ncbi:MAG: hypothetical protein NTV68_16215, partial [Methanomicrobiales archaeon]|nr:hypothetical protein [Methanomicrobiales archaeon]
VWYPWYRFVGIRAGKNRCQYRPKSEVPRKQGSAKSGLARGYRLTFAMTGLRWGRCCGGVAATPRRS